MDTKLYKNKDEILNAVVGSRIKGIVEIDFSESDLQCIGLDSWYEMLSDKLVTDEYGCFLEEIYYYVLGVNIPYQRLYIGVDADASNLLVELENNNE